MTEWSIHKRCIQLFCFTKEIVPFSLASPTPQLNPLMPSIKSYTPSQPITHKGNTAHQQKLNNAWTFLEILSNNDESSKLWLHYLGVDPRKIFVWSRLTLLWFVCVDSLTTVRTSCLSPGPYQLTEEVVQDFTYVKLDWLWMLDSRWKFKTQITPRIQLNPM